MKQKDLPKTDNICRSGSRLLGNTGDPFSFESTDTDQSVDRSSNQPKDVNKGPHFWKEATSSGRKQLFTEQAQILFEFNTSYDDIIIDSVANMVTNLFHTDTSMYDQLMYSYILLFREAQMHTLSRC